MEPLFRFTNDPHMRQALLEYIIDHFEKAIIDKAKRKEDVFGIASAIQELESVFYKLQETYGPKQNKQGNKVDQAA